MLHESEKAFCWIPLFNAHVCYDPVMIGQQTTAVGFYLPFQNRNVYL